MQEETRAFLRLPGGGGADDTGVRSGKEDRLEVWAWSHAVTSPRDAASGLPTGKRRHEPLVVTKPIDHVSRRLLAALLTDEVLPEVTLEIWRPTPTSERRGPVVHDLFDKAGEEALEIFQDRLRRSERRETLDYSIRLLNARVSGIESEMADAADIEHVSFSYERVAWSWGADGEAAAIESRWQGNEVAAGDSSGGQTTAATEPEVRVLVRQSRDGDNLWAAASVVGRGEPQSPRRGHGPAAGVELSYELEYRPDSRSHRGIAVTDAAGEAIIAVPPPSPGEPVREFRFSVKSAQRRQQRLPVAGEHGTGWIAV